MLENGYVHVHRVTYSECTVGNHIYYGRYLDLLEAARGEMFRAIGQPMLTLQNAGVIFPVIECRLRYRAPARYDDVLQIRVAVTQARGLRLSFRCVVTDQTGRLILEAETDHVCASLEEKPRRLQPELIAALQPFLVDAQPATNFESSTAQPS